MTLLPRRKAKGNHVRKSLPFRCGSSLSDFVSLSIVVLIIKLRLFALNSGQVKDTNYILKLHE